MISLYAQTASGGCRGGCGAPALACIWIWIRYYAAPELGVLMATPQPIN